MPELIRTVLWQRHSPPGAEYFGLWRDGDGWQLRGTVLLALSDVPARVRYGVVCDAAWCTRAVHIALRTGSEERALHLVADGAGRWESGGTELATVGGCLDVDLEITPATNTLPIRRLGLSPGETASLAAAWVRFPSLSIERLDQTYERLADIEWRYTSGTGCTADLETDDLGLVTRYADRWESIARQDFGRPG